MLPRTKPQKFQSRLAQITKVSANVYLETFDLVEPAEIEFLPGQTVMLQIAPGVNRSMSLAALPDKKKSILLVHDVAPMGPYSKWALGAKVGDPMNFIGPLGMFVVNTENPGKKIFVATGTGIAPFYAMICQVVARDPVVLYWGLRHEEDLFWHKEFEALAKVHSNFTYKKIFSGKGEGHVQDYLFATAPDTESEYYLCGNKNMVHDVRTRLHAAGVPEPHVKTELFY